MTPNRVLGWQVLSARLDEALELDGAARERWLEALATGDPELGAQLRGLLALHAQNQASGFMESAPFARAESLVGQQIGAYRIERLLGSGGMGSVWLGRRCDGRFEGLAALKLLERTSLGPHSADQVRHEANLLARLSHPNIARLLDVGVRENKQPYLILEYVQGEPIDRHCEMQGLALEARLRLLLTVFDAVSHAHAHLVVHRDLKPSNVLVTAEGVVKLLDFGIAALHAESPVQAADTGEPATAVALTPGYAAPEQLRGEPVAASVDVYALGVLLHLIVTGEHPFAAHEASHTRLVRATLTEAAGRASDRIRARAERRRVRGDLDAIIERAMQREPGARYATAAELSAEVRRFLDCFPVQARPASRAYVARKFARRNWGGILSASLTVLVLAAASAVTTLNMLEARRQRDLARAELNRAEAANDFSSLMLEEIGEGGQSLTRERLLDHGVQLLDARYGGDRAFVAGMLSQLAGRYGDEARNDKALSIAKQALALARQTGDPALILLTECAAAHQEEQGEPRPDVDGWLRDARQRMTQLRDPPLRARTACIRAEAERALNEGRSADAVTLLEEGHALQIAQGMHLGLDYTGVLSHLGTAYFEQGRYADAYRAALELGEAFDRGGRGGTLGRGIIHENLAASLLRMGEPLAALRELDLARNPAPGVRDDSSRSGMQGKVGLALRRIGRLQEARAALAGEADALLAHDAPRLGAGALIEEAAILGEMGEMLPAQQELERAIDILRNRGGRGLLERAQAYLADLEVAAGRPAAARARLEELLKTEHYVPAHANSMLQPALLSAARAALALGDLPAARRYGEDAVKLAEQAARGPDTSADVGDALIALAHIDQGSNRIAESRALIERAVRCYQNALGRDAPLAQRAREELKRVIA